MQCVEHKLSALFFCFSINCKNHFLCHKCLLTHEISHHDKIQEIKNIFQQNGDSIYAGNSLEPLKNELNQLKSVLFEKKSILLNDLKKGFDLLQKNIIEMLSDHFFDLKRKANDYFDSLELSIESSLKSFRDQQMKMDNDLKISSNNIVDSLIAQYNEIEINYKPKTKKVIEKYVYILEEEFPIFQNNQITTITNLFHNSLQTNNIIRLSFEKSYPLEESRIKDISCTKKISAHSDWINSITTLHSALLLASASSDHSIKIWNILTEDCLQVLFGHLDSVLSLAYVPGKQMLLSGSSDKTIKLWDYMKGVLDFTFSFHEKPIKAICLVKNTQIFFSGSSDGILAMWNLSEKKLINSIEAHYESINAIEDITDMKSIATASNDTEVRIFEYTKNFSKTKLKGHTDVVKTLSYMNDERTLISGGKDACLKIWNILTGQCIKNIELICASINSVLFVFQKEFVVVGSWDTFIRVVRLDNGKEILKITDEGNLIETMTYLKDGKTIVSGGGDNNLRIWSVKEEEKNNKNNLDSSIIKLALKESRSEKTEFCTIY